jgi:hypothetical protein
MSVKEIHDIRQKVFYIDRAVTPYLNIQIMKLYELNSNLTMKVKELEDKINNLSSVNTTSLQSEGTKFEERITEKKKRTTKKTEVTNDIRTINLE